MMIPPIVIVFFQFLNSISAVAVYIHTNSCSTKNCENESEALDDMKDLNNYVQI